MTSSFSWLPIVVSSFIAWITTPIAIAFAKKFDLIDYPLKNKFKAIHTHPVPRGGGLAIFLGLLISLWFFLPHDRIIISLAISLSLILIYGLLDDRYNLNPYLRFCLQIVAAAIPVINGVRINFTTNPFTNSVFDFAVTNSPLLQLLPYLFSIAWIVFLMNILNMGAKGVDGQLSGVVAISALVITVLSQRYSADIAQWPVTILSLIVAGAYLGVIPWNVYPQKIMPSFSGSNMGGFMLGVLSILSTAKVGTLLVTLGIPIIDTVYVMTQRVWSGKSPVWGDMGHLHHRLLNIGVSKKHVTYLYWFSTAILGTLALNLNATSKLYTIVGVTFLLGGLAIWLKKLRV